MSTKIFVCCKRFFRRPDERGTRWRGPACFAGSIGEEPRTSETEVRAAPAFIIYYLQFTIYYSPFVILHSYLSATMGSTSAARRAGM